MPLNLPVPYRIPLLITGFVSLICGIAAGLQRIGWDLTLPVAALNAFHGPLLVCGFLGTVISLERAVAIGKRWAYLAPLAAGLGGLAFITGQSWSAGVVLTVSASAILCLASGQIVLRQPALFTLTLLLGSVSWLLGNLLWLAGFDLWQVVPWWIGFLVLTIAGERLELSRLLPQSRHSATVFMAIIISYLAGAALVVLDGLASIRMGSAALLALALWLLRHDLARHTIRQTGLPRFIATCLLSGYAWLMTGAIIGLLSPALMPGSSYDAFLHAILIGFVFSMIFGHAPVIFPAIAKVRIPYHPTFYLPLIVLHGAMLARIGGDLLELQGLRSLGGAFNAIAIMLFILSTAAAVIRSKRKVS